jgi:tRNA A37 threonylcarbamoyladenosine dehydratase
MQHAFSRFEMLVGPDAIDKLKRSRVAVFGVGGVGSFAVEGLARSGVGKFILVDNDVICESNINRQIHATIKTIGRAKVDVMKERILDIDPDAEVETYQLFYPSDTPGDLLEGRIDYIVDAIDTVKAKLELIMKAKEKGIPIISSMGTGNKFDPSKLCITDISKTSVDPLARVMRKELRDRGIKSLKVLFSSEAPSAVLRPAEEEDDGNINKKRKGTPGSTAFVPTSAGLLIASEVVKDIIGRQITP